MLYKNETEVATNTAHQQSCHAAKLLYITETKASFSIIA